MFSGYKYFKGLYHAFFLTILIICAGTIGFRTIEGWSTFDSLYMTIITVTTVGFGEIHPLSTGGRVFASVLILTSFGTIAYAVSVITSYIASGELRKYRKDLNSAKSVKRMENHTIVCGYGRAGKQAAKELVYYGKSVVVIERNLDKLDNLPEQITFIQGDATHDETLLKAGIKKAGALITALPADTDNLFVVLSARELSPKMKIISRASDPSTVKKLKVGGADNVIMPDTVGGAHMASLTVTPDLMEFIDLIKVSGKSSVNLEEIRFDQLPGEFKSCTIGELENRTKSGCNVIGYRSPAGEYLINPDLQLQIEPGSKLFVLGNPDQINKINSHLGI